MKWIKKKLILFFQLLGIGLMVMIYAFALQSLCNYIFYDESMSQSIFDMFE